MRRVGLHYVIITVQTSADYFRNMPGHFTDRSGLSLMPARSVEVLRVISTEEHDGYRKDLGRPVIRQHDDLQNVHDYD